GTPARLQLWQLPAFVLGVAALAAVWHYRPTQSGHEGARLEPELAALRHALEQKPPDLDAALARGQELLAAADRAPQYAGEIHFLLGCALVIRAEAAPADAAEAAWRAARDHLEQADKWGVGQS